MPSFRTGVVTAILSERTGLQRVEVGGEKAYVLTQLVGAVALGDRVVMNTTAVDLGLGTGGWHVVHWNLARESWSQPGPGHIMKLRYTSLQVDTGAAEELGRFLPMLTTAAGTIRPATVMVLGAGVAGLQAIATARRLGAVVQAFDVRAAVKEQIESLGARFLELDLGLEDAEAAGGYARQLTDEEQQRQRELLADEIAGMDVVISTAAVPGRKAPLLVIEDAVKRMKPGSVIVDLAAETGGNCELTEPGKTVVKHDVTIAGPLNLPSAMPDHASQLYARNVQSLLELMVDEGQLKLDFDDEIIAGACITRDGQIVHEGAKQAAGGPAKPDRSREAGGRAGDQDAGLEAPRR